MDIHYLACPFTHSDLKVMKARVRATMHVQVELAKHEIHVFNPLPHAAHVQYELGAEFAHKFTMELDLEVIRRLCKDMYLLELDGWKESKGVRQELVLADFLCMKTMRLKPEDFGLNSSYPY